MIYILFYIFTEIKKAEPAPLRLCLSLFSFYTAVILLLFSHKRSHRQELSYPLRGLDLIRINLINIFLQNYEVCIFFHFDGSVLFFCIGA